MLFNSIQYVAFFAVVVPLYYCLPHKLKNVFLLCCSYFFYMCWNVKYSALLLFSTVITYAGGLLLCGLASADLPGEQRVRRRKWVVAAVLVCNLAVLGFFKYFYFIMETLEAICSLFPVRFSSPAVNILLPVGISFYIFQALGYTIDCYRGTIQPERSFLRYALFVSFFPQLVAGPIERSGNLLKQFREPIKFDYCKVRSGFLLILWGGVLKSIIADHLAVVVDTIYGNPAAYPGFYLTVATLLFALQIYCDFAGYSTIAIGSARVLGIDLMENFNAPYFAKSVAEFWRRWHISLSTWFRDYLYIPLGGNRKGSCRKYLNLMITFTVSGLWHGANWSFVVWGVLNGAFQVIDGCTRNLRRKIGERLGVRSERFSNRLLSHVLTFALIDFSWIFFRAKDIRQAFSIIKSMVTVYNPGILFDGSLLECGVNARQWNMLICFIVILAGVDYLKYRKIDVLQTIEAQGLWLRWAVYLLLVAAIVVFGVWGAAYNAASFVYFQF